MGTPEQSLTPASQHLPAVLVSMAGSPLSLLCVSLVLGVGVRGKSDEYFGAFEECLSIKSLSWPYLIPVLLIIVIAYGRPETIFFMGKNNK